MTMNKPSEKALKLMGESGHFNWTRVFFQAPEDVDVSEFTESHRNNRFGHTDFDESSIPGRCNLRVVFDDGETWWIPEEFLYKIVVQEYYKVSWQVWGNMEVGSYEFPNLESVNNWILNKSVIEKNEQEFAPIRFTRIETIKITKP